MKQLFIRYERSTGDEVIGSWDRVCDLDTRLYTRAKPYSPNAKRKPCAPIATTIVRHHRMCAFPRPVHIYTWRDLVGVYPSTA